MEASQIKMIKIQNIIPIIAEIFNSGSSLCLTVKGQSMHPFLREDLDRVELSPVFFDGISRADIVLIKRVNGQYVLHRVFRKEKGSFYIVGDAQQWIEGPLNPHQLVAVVTAVWRGNRKIEVNNCWWKFLSVLWLWLLPFRYQLLKTKRFLRKFFSNMLRMRDGWVSKNE